MRKAVMIYPSLGKSFTKLNNSNENDAQKTHI